MNTDTRPEIFFHVGLERTATTFFQKKVFPRLKGICYIKRRDHNRFRKIIAKTDHNKYLLSYEFFSIATTKLTEFARDYPDAKIIIVLRRQDSLIASHYKRRVKNGTDLRFGEFFETDTTCGRLTKQNLYLYENIEYIEKHFYNRPLVLMHDDFKRDPEKFLKRIMSYLGVSDHDQISFAPFHTSYNEKQMKVRLWFSRNFFIKEKKTIQSDRFRKLFHVYNRLLRHAIMYVSVMVPGFLISEAPLIPAEDLKRIRDLYKDDYERCKIFIDG